MTPWVEFVVAALIVIGTVFALVGSIGLVKLPDVMTRLHSPTKATTLGVGALLVASIISFYHWKGKLAINELLITLFLFLTAPVAAQFLARAYLHLHCDSAGDLPATNRPCQWSTFQCACPPDAEDGSAAKP